MDSQGWCYSKSKGQALWHYEQFNLLALWGAHGERLEKEATSRKPPRIAPARVSSPLPAQTMPASFFFYNF